MSLNGAGCHGEKRVREREEETMRRSHAMPQFTARRRPVEERSDLIEAVTKLAANAKNQTRAMTGLSRFAHSRCRLDCKTGLNSAGGIDASSV